jgi:cytoskeletal protein CcmA (bactofilin family)
MGTTSPDEMLHVTGNLKVEGNIDVAGCIVYNGGTLGSCI